MDRFDRIFQLHHQLSKRRTPISLKALEENLECSRATVNRTISNLRNYLNAPLAYDRSRNGYYYDTEDGRKPFELPGLWFNASELYALTITLQLLAEVEPGVLSEHLAPLFQRIEALLHQRHAGSRELTRRVKVLGIAARPIDMEHFRKIAEALATRRRLKILYHGRHRDKTTERTISPQRLIYYKSNWYLDGWCHLRKGLRSFSLDRLHPIVMLDKSTTDISETELDAHFKHSYGIFAGPAKHTAKIRFTPEIGKWVADEQWHPEQHGEVHKDGSYTLKVPYNDPTELMMDILKYGAEAEVLGPPALREAVKQRLEAALKQYTKAKNRPAAQSGPEGAVNYRKKKKMSKE